MAKQLQLRRGTTAQHGTFTGAVGEVTIDTDKDVIVVHDGTTVGGIPSAKDSVVMHLAGAETISGVKTFSAQPVGITKASVGLGNADNTSDANKPVSTAQATAIGLKVTANSNITAGTATKITYDAKGLVTSGTTLSASDIPSLDASKITTGTIDAARLPSYVDDVIEGTNLAAFPVTGETSKIYIALDTNKTYRWSGSAYVYITSGAVDSVAGKTGVVTLVKGDVGLGSVDNTADTAKPVSTAQATAIALKANIASPTFTGTVSGITATMVGLGNVTNESKATMFTSPTFTGNTSGLGAATGTSFNSITALASSVSPMDGTAAVGTSTTVARQDHIHASDTSKASLAGATFTGAVAGTTFSATTFTGALSGNATTATKATNLVNGSAGTIPYQSAANTTVQLAAGTSGQFLKSNGAAAPSWVSPTEIISIDNLTGVTVTSPTTNQVLTYNGTTWVNSTAAIDNAVGTALAFAIALG